MEKKTPSQLSIKHNCDEITWQFSSKLQSPKPKIADVHPQKSEKKPIGWSTGKAARAGGSSAVAAIPPLMRCGVEGRALCPVVKTSMVQSWATRGIPAELISRM